MSDFFRESIVEPIVAWIEQEFPDIPVLVMRQNVERPDEDYFGLEFVTALTKPGSRDDTIHQEGTTFTLCGQRTFTIAISSYLVKTANTFGVHKDLFVPHGRLKQLQDSVDNPVKMEVLRNAGLAVWDAGDILDIPDAVETGFESRASMDVIMGIVSSRDVDLGAIDKVEFTGTADGIEEPSIIVNDD